VVGGGGFEGYVGMSGHGKPSTITVTCACVQQVRVHERTHTGHKPYKCAFCNYRSAQGGNIRIHERRHTGERPYPCPLCPFAAVTSSATASHMKSMHPDAPATLRPPLLTKRPGSDDGDRSFVGPGGTSRRVEPRASDDGSSDDGKGNGNGRGSDSGGGSSSSLSQDDEDGGDDDDRAGQDGIQQPLRAASRPGAASASASAPAGMWQRDPAGLGASAWPVAAGEAVAALAALAAAAGAVSVGQALVVASDASGRPEIGRSPPSSGRDADAYPSAHPGRKTGGGGRVEDGAGSGAGR
jgi:hypothetical protein